MTDRLPSSSRGRWAPPDVLAMLGLIGLSVLATWAAWSDIFWLATNDEEQSHILLVPIVAVWLVWIRRGRLRRCPRDGRWIGSLVVALGWLLYSAGDLLLIQMFWHLGAIVAAVGCFLSFSGLRYLRRLAPAFVVLMFMVPIPGIVRQEFSLPLQQATAEATRRALVFLGVEATRTGNAISVNGANVLIAEACNGLRMVFALFLVSFAFAYGTPIREPVRFFILLMSPLTAIACNVVRLVPTVWVYGFVSMDAGERMHELGGWIMLPVAFLLLMVAFKTLRWALVPVYKYTLAYGR